MSVRSMLTAAFLALVLGSGGALAATPESALPAVRILATGGTIAGTPLGPEPSAGYRSGQLGVDALIRAVPGIAKWARLSGEQFSNISSNNVTPEMLLELARRINEVLADPEIDGLVVTHGTDSIEETAYFLNLTVRSEKPVVLVGSMRPSSALSADGPMNLLEAVQAAASSAMRGLGVTIVMNGRIAAARETTKFNTRSVAAFEAPEYGFLGVMVEGEPRIYRLSSRRHTAKSEFDVSKIKSLPRVDILYSYAGTDGRLVDAALEAGARGIVNASMGNCSVADGQDEAYRRAMRTGHPVVLSERVPTGECVLRSSSPEEGYVSAGNLNPQKARLLLQLALATTRDIGEIRRIFSQY